jgi:hypothetical protein
MPALLDVNAKSIAAMGSDPERWREFLAYSDLSRDRRFAETS